MRRSATRMLACFIPAIGLLAPSAGAALYKFQNITSNNNTDASIGHHQLSLSITQYAPGQALFEYVNTGANACVVTDIYVDDGTLLEINTILNIPGYVEFAEYPKPPDLPGGNELTPKFNAISWLSADADSPPAHKGINPGEALAIIYDLKNGGTIQDVYDEMITGELRIGIHVQGYQSGGSESFITIVPEPAGALLLLLGSGLFLRRKSYPISGEYSTNCD